MKGTLATGIVILSLALAGAVGVLVFGWTVAPDDPKSPPIATVRDSPATQTKRATSEPSSAAPAPAAVAAAVETLKALGNPVAPRSDRTPSFDLSRIEPNGNAVIAGRAAPGAAVELLRGAEVHDRTVANPSGEFVFVPKPLPPGNYDLTLRATKPDGQVSTSKDSVAVALRSGSQEKMAAQDKPVVALAAPAKPAVMPSKSTADAAAALTIGVVEARAEGSLYVSGQSAPGASVRLYLNDAYIASATASPEGRVAFAIQSGVKPGDYRIRLDQVDAGGSVRSRAAVPFKAPVTIAAPASPAAPPLSIASTRGLEMPSAAPSAATPTPPAAAVATPPRPDPSRTVVTPDAGSAPAPSAVLAMPQPVPSEPPPRSAAARQTSPAFELAAAPPTPLASQDNVSTSAGTPRPPVPATAAPALPTKTLSEVISPALGDRPSVVVVPKVDTTLVIRGDNLWRISRTTYGDGLRYPMIFAANRDQIRDPDLIYPGQIFVLPKAMPAAAN